jgi:hypothetical protein
MSIERLLKPRSIAVFGGFQAEEVIRQSDRMGYKGEMWTRFWSRKDQNQ